MTKWERLVVLVMALVIVVLMGVTISKEIKIREKAEANRVEILEALEEINEVGGDWMKNLILENVDEMAYNLTGMESN